MNTDNKIGSDKQDSSTSNQNQKQTQNFPKISTGLSEDLGGVYGGKIHRREQDVRDILDDQIAGASSLDKLNKSSANQAPKK